MVGSERAYVELHHFASSSSVPGRPGSLEPALHLATAHLHQVRVGRRDELGRLLRVDAHQDPALAASADGHTRRSGRLGRRTSSFPPAKARRRSGRGSGRRAPRRRPRRRSYASAVASRGLPSRRVEPRGPAAEPPHAASNRAGGFRPRPGSSGRTAPVGGPDLAAVPDRARPRVHFFIGASARLPRSAQTAGRRPATGNGTATRPRSCFSSVTRTGSSGFPIRARRKRSCRSCSKTLASCRRRNPRRRPWQSRGPGGESPFAASSPGSV